MNQNESAEAAMGRGETWGLPTEFRLDQPASEPMTRPSTGAPIEDAFLEDTVPLPRYRPERL